MTTQVDATRLDHAALKVQRVLVPSDFSPASNAALKCALSFQQEFGAKVTVLHVLEPSARPCFNGVVGALADLEKQPVRARKQLRAWIDSAAAADPTAKLIVRTGLPAHEIVQAAKDLDIDLIIMATNGLGGWKHFCIGRTAESVVRAAPCSVLTVREKEHHFIC